MAEESTITTATAALGAGLEDTTAPADTTAPVEAGAETTPPTEAEAPASPAVPGKDATPEEWAAFYAALGKPETPDAYELPVPEGDDGTFAKEVAPLLHKANLTGEQAKALAEGWNELVAAKQAEQNAALEAEAKAMHVENQRQHNELMKEWGQNADANMEYAARAIKQFVPGDKDQRLAVVAAVESVMGYRGAIEFFHGIGKGLGESDAAGIDAGNGGGQPLSLAERLYGKQG